MCHNSTDNDNGDLTVSLCMLASGSKGNCIHISAGDRSLLVDAGLSGREIERRMRQRDLSPDNLLAIVVSHEHADHIRGVGVLARRYGLPVYMSGETECAALPVIGKLPRTCHFHPGKAFTIPPFTIHPFHVSHDAVDPVGFTIAMNGSRIGIATDLGIATALVEQHLKGCHFLVIEANHDLDMLTNGPYPWPLKQRIKGRNGHLSNEAAEALLRNLMHADLKHVILGHLSETNNTSRQALKIVKQAIGTSVADITVALQNSSGPVLTL
ncbi:MAG: MBL fold metallo-hydrolase [Desulfobacteraceae bacterium]|nr:MBL fold metallo-hydrolase [Desulfobacteraceae bacterium]MBC2753473.1 MBL fold metallo-hydrolase [Desulfobacteraceae bacterium]